jgi:hypothetical protein
MKSRQTHGPVIAVAKAGFSTAAYRADLARKAKLDAVVTVADAK